MSRQRRRSAAMGTLTDAGPLIALIDRDQPAHERCVAVLPQLFGPMITVAAAFTESIHVLGRIAGWAGQKILLDWAMDGTLRIAEYAAEAGLAPDARLMQRCAALMEQYHDIPMDFADAMLVATAERHGIRRVFSLDRHFHAYRLWGKTPFEVVPAE